MSSKEDTTPAKTTPQASTPNDTKSSPAPAPAPAPETPAASVEDTATPPVASPAPAKSEVPPAVASEPQQPPVIVSVNAPTAAVVPVVNSVPAFIAPVGSPSLNGPAMGQEVPAVATQQTLTAAAARLKDVLDAYAIAMAPGVPLPNDTGAMHQLALYRILVQALNSPGNEFTPLWTQFLSWVLANATGVCSELYFFRFFPMLRMARNEIRNFENILHLALTTADPKTRSIAVKQVDLAVVLKNLNSAQVVQNIRGYYAP